MDATNCWDVGYPRPSIKAEVLSYLKQHEDEMFEVVDLRDEFFDVTIPEKFDNNGIIDFAMATQKQAVVEQSLEQLVDEGKVEKRLFIRDTAGAIADVAPDEQYDDVYEYISGIVSEANLENETEVYYYRIADRK